MRVAEAEGLGLNVSPRNLKFLWLQPILGGCGRLELKPFSKRTDVGSGMSRLGKPLQLQREILSFIPAA